MFVLRFSSMCMYIYGLGVATDVSRPCVQECQLRSSRVSRPRIKKNAPRRRLSVRRLLDMLGHAGNIPERTPGIPVTCHQQRHWPPRETGRPLKQEVICCERHVAWRLDGGPVLRSSFKPLMRMYVCVGGQEPFEPATKRRARQ